ncbi:MAG: helix-turn-helix transcriptional regulator [Acutalibacteraceae bacterium]|nr:helix-turn-helix transcriptional regulator [Acutalibacteraceae bacterium]
MNTKQRKAEEIRIRIAYFRKKAGLTQNEVADAIEMARSTYSYYETKAMRFPQDFLEKVAKVLDIPVSSFNVETKTESDISFLTFSDFPSGEYKESNYELDKKERVIITIYRALPEEIQPKVLDFLFSLGRDNIDLF